MESVLCNCKMADCAYIAWIRSTGDKVERKCCEKRQYVAINKSERTPVFSPGFFEGVVGGGAGIRARRWEK